MPFLRNLNLETYRSIFLLHVEISSDVRPHDNFGGN